MGGALCQGGAATPPPTPTLPIATKLLSEGPAPRRSYFYLFTVCAFSSCFPPSGSAHLAPSHPHPTLSKGAGSQTAWMEPVSCSEWARDPVAERWEQAVFGLRAHIFVSHKRLAHQYVPCLGGVTGRCGACKGALPLATVVTGIWPLGFQWVFSATIPPRAPIPSSWLGTPPTPIFQLRKRSTGIPALPAGERLCRKALDGAPGPTHMI